MIQPKLGNLYKDDQGRTVEIIAELKTCCSPKFFHGRLTIDGQVNVFAYDTEGCVLSHLFVQQKTGKLIEKL